MKSLSYLKKSLNLLSYFRVAAPKRHPHKPDVRDGTPALTFSYSVTSMLVYLFFFYSVCFYARCTVPRFQETQDKVAI